MWAWRVMAATRISWYRLRTRYPRQWRWRTMAAQVSFKARAVTAFLETRVQGDPGPHPVSSPVPSPTVWGVLDSSRPRLMSHALPVWDNCHHPRACCHRPC